MSKTVTLSSIRTQARQRADMVNSSFVTDSELNGYINNSAAELYDLLVQKFGNDYYLSTSNITADGTNDQFSLPTDFYKLVGVEIQVTGNDWITLRPFMFQERNRYSTAISRTIYGVTDIRYRVQGSNMRFAPIPTANQVFRLWYVPVITTLVSDSDTLDGVNGYEEYVIVDAAIKCLQKEETDCSVLLTQKQALIKRVEEAAENRDSGGGDRISDVRRTDYDRFVSWYV